MIAGLYIHIPFCTIRCGYCDFFTVAHREDQIPAYLTALKTEMTIHGANLDVRELEFGTVYFGGGTPSLLSAAQIESLLGEAGKNFRLTPDPEITVETNPGTVTLQNLREFRAVGVNRLSIGMQSFQSEELAFLDRDHSAEASVACFGDARAAGFDNISVDLIFGLPRQTPEAWGYNLQRSVELEPEHISTYNLTYENGTPLTTQLQKGAFKVCPEPEQRTMKFDTMDYLANSGYGHYEISNYARPGYESRHNQKYWDGSAYLGLGASAHSKLRDRRFWNVRNFSAYHDLLAGGKPATQDEEILGLEEKTFEQIFLGLRQRRGINVQAFQAAAGTSLFEKYATPLRKFFERDFTDEVFVRSLTEGGQQLKSKLLEFEEGSLKLTNEGILVYDAICAEFL